VKRPDAPVTSSNMGTPTAGANTSTESGSPAGCPAGSAPGEAVEVPEADRSELLAWTRSPTITAGSPLRASIVLRAGAGEGTSAIARELRISRPTVIAWRERYRSGGIAALEDAPRSGRPKTVDEAVIIARTLEPPPSRLGVTPLVDASVGRGARGQRCVGGPVLAAVLSEAVA
jgi:hypothetical protein